jgi:hypothetical protein
MIDRNMHKGSTSNISFYQTNERTDNHQLSRVDMAMAVTRGATVSCVGELISFQNFKIIYL